MLWFLKKIKPPDKYKEVLEEIIKIVEKQKERGPNIVKTTEHWYVLNRMGRKTKDYWDGKSLFLSHRYVYMMLIGPIPPNYTLERTCGDDFCVDPDHLKLVSPRERNYRRKKKRVLADNGFMDDDIQL